MPFRRYDVTKKCVDCTATSFKRSQPTPKRMPLTPITTFIRCCCHRCYKQVYCPLVCLCCSLKTFLHAVYYDTIRDATLTCARKPTWVSLIYRTETTTKNCKTEKLKSKNGYARSNSESLGNHVVSPEEEKERLQWDLQKMKVLSLEWKTEWVMEN